MAKNFYLTSGFGVYIILIALRFEGQSSWSLLAVQRIASCLSHCKILVMIAVSTVVLASSYREIVDLAIITRDLHFTM